MKTITNNKMYKIVKYKSIPLLQAEILKKCSDSDGQNWLIKPLVLR